MNNRKQTKQQTPAIHMTVKCWKLIEVSTTITHKSNDLWMAPIPYESVQEVLDRDFDDEMGFPWQVEFGDGQNVEGKWSARVCDVDGNFSHFYPADGMDELYFGIEWVKPVPLSSFMETLLSMPSFLTLIKT
jgi:hypothetical protein